MSDNVEQFIQGMPSEQQLRYLPEHSRNSMYHYIMEGRPVGSFLQAILSNDFMAAAGHADDVNKRCLFDYAFFLFNWAPALAHGSQEAYTWWTDHGGLRGILADAHAAAELKASAGNAAAASPDDAATLDGGGHDR